MRAEALAGMDLGSGPRQNDAMPFHLDAQDFSVRQIAQTDDSDKAGADCGFTGMFYHNR